MKSHFPIVTFIIPTLNAAWTLDRCLTAIRKQTYPQKRVEILVVDGGSTDGTINIAKKHHAKILANKAVFQEIGKTHAGYKAKGDIRFYTDADNILVGTQWIQHMVKPCTEHPEVLGFLPQTTAPPDSPALNQYLGFLFTDPFTWFLYGTAANPADYEKRYKPLLKTDAYILYKFPLSDPPLFGLAQGVGVRKRFQRKQYDKADDMLAGIQLLKKRAPVAYVSKAQIYHYHVKGWEQFIKKYRWKVRNNLSQTMNRVGIVHRIEYFSWKRKARMGLFIPYAYSIIFPLFDAVRLSIRYNSPVMLWHIPATIVMATIIVGVYAERLMGTRLQVGTYE